MLNELVTLGVLQPTPLKKNLVPRFEAGFGKGENAITFGDQGLHERLHDFELNHTGI